MSADEYADSRLERAWLNFTDGEYYHRLRAIMLSHGMGEGDVEMTLANVWEFGWMAARHAVEEES